MRNLSLILVVPLLLFAHAPARTAELQTVTAALVSTSWNTGLPTAVARGAGFFHEQGLDVRPVTLASSGPIMMALLMSGQSSPIANGFSHWRRTAKCKALRPLEGQRLREIELVGDLRYLPVYELWRPIDGISRAIGRSGVILTRSAYGASLQEEPMWYLIHRRPVRPREEWTVSLDEHLVWMKQQHAAGRILFSGPTPDRKLGIYVIRAGSREEAERIAGSDPYTKAGFCAFELFEWEVHQVLGAGPFTAAELRAHR